MFKHVPHFCQLVATFLPLSIQSPNTEEEHHCGSVLFSPQLFPQTTRDHFFLICLKKMSAVALMIEKQLFPQPGSDGICGPA